MTLVPGGWVITLKVLPLLHSAARKDFCQSTACWMNKIQRTSFMNTKRNGLIPWLLKVICRLSIICTIPNQQSQNIFIKDKWWQSTIFLNKKWTHRFPSIHPDCLQCKRILAGPENSHLCLQLSLWIQGDGLPDGRGLGGQCGHSAFHGVSHAHGGSDDGHGDGGPCGGQKSLTLKALPPSSPLVQGANQACTSRESVQITISQCKNTLLRSRFRAIRLPWRVIAS